MDFDRSLARALLRLALGVNLLMHGLVRLSKLRVFAEGMARDFSGTVLPAALARGFGLCLPFAELAVGALLVIGLRQRRVLVGSILMMVTLIIGTALLQRWDTLTQQMVYVFLYAALLATRSWDRWSMDARPP
jgi:thiosulfate dehydrogenase [quinone] large subunit